MPFYRKPRNFTPLHTLAERKSVKNGVHHAIFTSRFDRYVGDWVKDKRDGKGMFLTCTGKLYEGDFLDGYRHGFGILSRRQDDNTFTLVYRGEWYRGKPEGIGWWYFENGDIYLGYCHKGHRHGYGKMWYSDGTQYIGYWNMNLREGLGMFLQVNGNRYEGSWREDAKNGIGRFYHLHTGQLQEGIWVNNICVQSYVTDIEIRQFCDRPTQYPIPPDDSAGPRLEKTKAWLSCQQDEIDKRLQDCIDSMKE